MHPEPSAELTTAAKERLWTMLAPTEEVLESGEGILVKLRSEPGRATPRRADALAAGLMRTPLHVAGQDRRIDVGVSWAAPQRWTPGTIDRLEERSRAALAQREPGLLRRAKKSRIRRFQPGIATQVALLILLTVVLPFALMVAAERNGIHLADVLLVIVAAALALTIGGQWVETTIGAFARTDPPETEIARPLASAIIAAYLPNEQDTIMETLQVFLRHEYAGGLQVILAYNTPKPLPVEAELRRLAAANPRLTLAKVDGSTSKAQNVNAAVSLVRGEFVGLFDADHQPDPGSFDRAWRWIASGVDIVQGHCVVRNGDESWVARTVAVEFEQIYAVSHRGRQLLHGYGIFGGSNGYWRTELLRTTRMRGSMLTEDIDSSLRAIRAGARIENDPRLISRELAPTTLGALWRQRMRWSQGWTQVALAHSGAVLWGDELTPRQRVGLFFHMLWRESYPFISALVVPLLAFYLWHGGGLTFGNPALLVLMLFAFTTTPLAVLLTRRVADPQIARRASWWGWYLVVSMVFYHEFKNVISRIGVMRLMLSAEQHWTVTPRTAPVRAASAVPVEITAG
ncbi:glycosyltransferase family 2 protein [Micropruina sp.]|uniref:glycosyltransferase family 2 protein n=1 Tax=Micropruina sp. TaxID=2737536 RepID=UPI0039E577D5